MIKKVHLIAAARPNFMKIGPLYHAMKSDVDLEIRIVHTGQHYDANMSDSFFTDLALPDPDYHLGVGSGSHAEQTGRTMIEYEKVLVQDRPDLVIVVGDVNATVACAMVAVKCHTPVAHLEAGLRSRDRRMPEEINRVLVDSIADLLWTPSEDADRNLSEEGVERTRIERVGNIMIDSLEMKRRAIESNQIVSELNLSERRFFVATLHRPSNVDCRDKLSAIVEVLVDVAKLAPLVFPLHPRTRGALTEAHLLDRLMRVEGVYLLEPLSYEAFMRLVMAARLLITDSGGIQEETTYLGIPCLTMRENTERPVTISQGTNKLTRVENLLEDVVHITENSEFRRPVIDLWDGKSAGRVRSSARRFLGLSDIQGVGASEPVQSAIG